MSTVELRGIRQNKPVGLTLPYLFGNTVSTDKVIFACVRLSPEWGPAKVWGNAVGSCFNTGRYGAIGN